MALAVLTQQLLITEALIALLPGLQQEEGCSLKATAELGSLVSFCGSSLTQLCSSSVDFVWWVCVCLFVNRL